MIKNKLNLLSFIIGMSTISMGFAECTNNHGACLSITNVDTVAGTLEIRMNNSEAVKGFELELFGITLTGISGGLAQDLDFTQYNATTHVILGTSFGTNVIAPDSAVLVNVTFSDYTGNGICLGMNHADGSGTAHNVFSSTTGSALVTYWGDCYDLDLSNDPISDNKVPTEFAISQNYPNPFNPVTSISFDVVKRDEISVVVFDLAGKEIITLASGTYTPGRYLINWDAVNNVGDAIASGMYVYRYISSDQAITRKMLYLK